MVTPLDMPWIEHPTDPKLEGTFRRGYHQAVAAAADALRRSPNLTADQLMTWVNGPGASWRKDQSLERQIQPPAISAIVEDRK